MIDLQLFLNMEVTVKTAQGIYMGICKELTDIGCALQEYILITNRTCTSKNDIRMSADFMSTASVEYMLEHNYMWTGVRTDGFVFITNANQIVNKATALTDYNESADKPNHPFYTKRILVYAD